MKMETVHVHVTLDAAMINAALSKIIETNLLCADCLAKIEAAEKWTQSDLCSNCRVQLVISTFLDQLIEARLQAIKTV
jgi:predicted amidophosphoribosyltransferase